MVVLGVKWPDFSVGNRYALLENTLTLQRTVLSLLMIRVLTG